MAKEKPDTWMPLFIGDYKKDTTKLRGDAHGAYLLILMEYWVNGPPSDDDEELARITSYDIKAWRKIRPKIAHYFRIEDGKWWNKRAENEIVKWTDRRARYIERSRAANEAKYGAKGEDPPGKSSKRSLKESYKDATKETLKVSPSTSAGREDGPTGHSSPSGKHFPNDLLRTACVERWGEDWTRSWLDPQGWRDLPSPAVVCRNELAEQRLRRDIGPILRGFGISLTRAEIAA